MINSNEIMHRNNVPFNAQSVPLSQSGQPIAIPAMQGNMQDSYISNRAKQTQTDWLALPAGVATWYGICKGMDYFNNVSCDKAYMDTPFGKLGAWGDKMSDKYFNSAFAKSDAGKGFHNFLGNTKKSFLNFVNKNKVLSAIWNTPTTPENKMVIGQSKGLFGFHSMEVDTLIPSFLEQSEVPQQLERYGMKQDAIDKLKQALKGKKKAERLALIEAEEFKLFGVKNADDLRAAKIKALGFKDTAQFDKISKDYLKHADEILEALKKSNPNMYITRCTGEGTLGGVKKLFFSRKATFKELANKYTLLIDNPHKSGLGKFLSKGLGWVLEGATNRFAGGKMVAIMQAFILSQAALTAFRAEGGVGEKVKTFIERNVNDFSYIFAAPLAIMGMHRVGGMKYAGMTKEQVDKYREALKAFNEKADAKGFATKAEYKTAKGKLKAMLQGDTKNGFFTKMFKKIGSFINIGNEKINPYLSKADNNMNFIRKLGKWTTNAAGYPLRFGLAMFVLMPFVSKTITKASNAIFGKPKVSVLDEEQAEEQKTKDENVNNQLALLRQEAMARQQATMAHQQMAQQYQNAPKMDMLSKYKQGQNGYNTVTNTTNINNTYVGQPQQQEQKQPEPVRTYIPSPVGVQVAAPNMDAANAAMQRSMNAEQEALRMLAM